MDKPYSFRFYRCVTNDTGRPYDATIEVIDIQRAKTPERALQAAVRRFLRHQKVSAWDCLATGYDMPRGAERRSAREPHAGAPA